MKPKPMRSLPPPATRDTGADHPSIEQLVSYQLQGTPTDESIQDHVASCRECAQTLLDLATFRGGGQEEEDLRTRREASLVARNVIAEHRRRSWIIATSVAASLVLGCLGLMIFRELSILSRNPRSGLPHLPRGVTNLPLAALYPTSFSRAGEAVARLEIPTDAVAIGLILGTGKVTHFRDYRVVIRDPTGHELPPTNGLKPGEGGEFRILVPAQDLGNGLHRIILSGGSDQRQEVVEEYLLEVIHQK